MSERNIDPHLDPNSPATLTRVADEIAAAAILSALAANGIDANIIGGFTAGFRAEAPGDIAICVRHSDLAESLQVLADIESQTEPVDWSQVDVGEPEDPAA